MPVTLQAIDQFTHIEIDRSSAHELSPDDRERVDRAWHDLCARNPKYFNAPILVFDRYDPASGVIIAHIDEYKHHAIRHSVDLGISLLAITAVLCRPDRVRNAPTYLIGKRSTQSHMYGGLWELGPSGGIEPPSDDNAITFRGLIGQVDREVREEIGLSVIHQPAAAVSLVHDAYAGSTDIHIGFVLADAHEPDPNWEYDETRWITLEDLIAWCDTKPDEIIPTTIAHARFLHKARA